MTEVLTIAGILGFVYGIFRISTKYLYPDQYAGEEIRLNEADRQWLLEQGSFYAGLSRRNQRRFEERLKEMVYEKNWIGHGITVTREMKVRIAGALVQVTFGFPDLLLLHFQRIVIHPNAYENRRTGKLHVGEATPGAMALAFSWKHFVHGFDNMEDAFNVGLHEVAHALWFENVIPNAEVDFLPQRALERWRRLGREEMERIRHGHSRLFRDYAGTNEAEFFAVAVEYFFEQPRQYRESMPELYACMVELLRQNPLGR